MTLEQPERILATARLAANRAGTLVRENLRQPKRLTQKGYRDWVTDVDVAVQQTITTLIRERHPTHGFLAEEASSSLPAQGDARWIVDPIDGTTNYSRQQPNFCISIAAASDSGVQVGVILDPMRDELFSASRGEGAYLNDVQIHVSETQQLRHAVVAFDWAHSEQERQATLDSLQHIAHEVRSLRSVGSAALTMVWVAAGRLDAYWNWHLNPWDLAAAALIVEEAGGQSSAIGPGQLTIAPGGSSCLLSNTLLHDSLQRLLATKSPF